MKKIISPRSLLTMRGTARHAKNLTSGFLARSDINQAVQPLKIVQCLTFRIKETDVLHYLHASRERKADQPSGYLPVYLHLCFHKCKKGFLMMRLKEHEILCQSFILLIVDYNEHAKFEREKRIKHSQVSD